MKTLSLLAIVAGGLAVGACLGQEQVARLVPPSAVAIDPATGMPFKEAEPEKKFDLDFKGGPPLLLVETVEQAAKMPLNAIVPEEYKKFTLPPLRLRNVTVPQLFAALTSASPKSEARYSSPNSWTHVTTRYGFRSSDQRPGSNSIWYFFVEEPPSPPVLTPPQPHCRFWQLEPYLEKHKVEDITTAIETGWKMLGINPAPKLSFHKDTKLLIVVGPASQLTTVDDVLRELTPGKENRLRPAPSPSARQ